MFYTKAGVRIAAGLLPESDRTFFSDLTLFFGLPCRSLLAGEK